MARVKRKPRTVEKGLPGAGKRARYSGRVGDLTAEEATAAQKMGYAVKTDGKKHWVELASRQAACNLVSKLSGRFPRWREVQY